MQTRPRLRPRRISLALLVLGIASACAGMRQNMRGEFVSYRGAWFCAKKGCAEGEMERSTKAHRNGELTINHGKLQNGAAFVFSAGKIPDTLTATVKDCTGRSADVPGDKIKVPGAHAVAGQGDGYAVLVIPSDYPSLELGDGCDTWIVTTHSTWPKGKWDQSGGAQAE